tara:strand:+ start:266 stop:547 length:282 start_codon:yes stop_codon:yes gene_type:complete
MTFKKETKKIILNKPFKSKQKYKKYSVYVLKDGKRRLIHFGDKRYQHFKDRIGHYSHLDHNDKKRRENYYKRHKEKNIKDKSRPKYWSHKILW